MEIEANGGCVPVGCGCFLVAVALKLALWVAVIYGVVQVVKWAWGH